MKNFEKIFGWILLVLGILIICWSLYASYSIFLAKKSAPEVFKTAEEQVAVLPQKGKTLDLQVQMEKTIQEQLRNIIPAAFISNLLNLISWSIFAGILILGGGKISGIGIKLMRK